MFSGKGGCCCEDQRYNAKPSVVVWLCEVMETEIAGKKEDLTKILREECIKKNLKQHGLRREDVYDREKWQEQVKSKIANPRQPVQ